MSVRADLFNGVQELIRSQLVETGIPSLTVAAARDGEILWEEDFGWADRENRIPATPHTLYSLASISKPITATGLMVLVERGKIDLDHPLNDYLGEAQVRARVGDAGDATVRRVANHSSGLPLHYHFFFEDEPDPLPAMDETLRRYGNLVTVPGERYQYSNLGYGILGHVISRVSGKPYPDFMREEVFLPLGLTHASVNVGQGLEKYRAARYGPNGLPIPFYDFDHPAASAVFCSAHDLVRFGMFHLKAHLPDQRAILSDQAIDAMQQPTMEIGEGAGYGVGWRIVENEMGFRTVSHGGGMGGVSTLLKLIPSENLAVVTLANASSPLPERIAQEICATLLPTYAENRTRWESEQKQKQEKKQEPVFKPSPDLIGQWAGNAHTCKGEIPFTLQFQEDGDVHVRLGDQLRTLLNDARFEDGYLTGRMMGDLGTEDTRRRSSLLHVTMKLRGQTLNGAMSAISQGPRGNALTHWVEVRRENGG